MSRTQVNPMQRVRQLQQGGTIIPRTQTHRDRRNPTGKQQRKSWQSQQNRGIDF